MQFSVNDLLNYNRCPRLLFLNKYGNKIFQLPPSEFLKKLWKMGRGYESNVIDFFDYKKPKYKVGNYEEGFKQTLDLMKAGTETIYQGVLKNDDVIGIPDLLIKTKGFSSLGNFYYYAVDIKGASTVKEKYLFQLASYSYLIGEIQEFTPLYGGLLLLDMDLKIKYFHDLIPEVLDAIKNGNKILQNQDEIPDLFIDSTCSQCQWYSFCLPEAKEKCDLSLIPIVNREIKNELLKIEIKNYKELSKCTEEDFINIKALNGDKGKNLILQSIALTENKFYLKKSPEISECDKEIFFDFESDFIFDSNGTDLLRIDYLVGILKHDGKDYIYNYYFLDEEEKFLEAFGNFLELHSDYIFYHYGNYEQTILNGKWDNLPKVKLFNIEKTIRDSLVMPVTGYSLKNIAKYLGFSWTSADSSATQSMCWYSKYLETKDKKYLDLSIQYNEDDCRALLKVKNWLCKLKNQKDILNTFIELKDS